MLQKLQSLFLLSVLTPAFHTLAVPITCETHSSDSVAILPSMAVPNYNIQQYSFRDEKNNLLTKVHSPRYILKNRLEGQIFFTTEVEKSTQLFTSFINLADRNHTAQKISNISPMDANIKSLYESIRTKSAAYFLKDNFLYFKNANNLWEKRALTDLTKSISLPALKNAESVSTLDGDFLALLKVTDGKSKATIYSEKTGSLTSVPQQISGSSQFNVQMAGGLIFWSELSTINYKRSVSYFVSQSDFSKIIKIDTQLDQEIGSAPVLVLNSQKEIRLLLNKEKFKNYTNAVFNYRGVESGFVNSLKIDPVNLQILNNEKIEYTQDVIDKINYIKVSISAGLVSPVWIQEDDQLIFSAGNIGGTISYSFQKKSWNLHGNLGNSWLCEYPERNQ